jgi:hypothetical protein
MYLMHSAEYLLTGLPVYLAVNQHAPVRRKLNKFLALHTFSTPEQNLIPQTFPIGIPATILGGAIISATIRVVGISIVTFFTCI